MHTYMYVCAYVFIYLFIFILYSSNSIISTGKILCLYEDFRNVVYIIILVYLSV
jgi:hypothetical protein